MRFVFERMEPTGSRMLVQVRDSVLNFRFWAGRFSPVCPCVSKGHRSHGDSQPAGAQAAQPEDLQERLSGVAELPAAARRVYPRVHHHAEKAELGDAQSGEGAAYQRL